MRTDKSLLIAAIFVFGVTVVFAQTPPEFTYQGSLKDGANAANGNYDFEIKLYNASTGGAPIGTRTRLNVPVTNGVFIVKLDFAGAAFNGDDRFLEIGVRLAGGGGYQQLLPRQQINHVPYSIRSVQANQADTATRAEDSLQLGGVAAAQFVLTQDTRLFDERTPSANSVTTSKIANQAVTLEKIETGAIDSTKLHGFLGIGIFSGSLSVPQSSSFVSEYCAVNGRNQYSASDDGTPDSLTPNRQCTARRLIVKSRYPQTAYTKGVEIALYVDDVQTSLGCIIALNAQGCGTGLGQEVIPGGSRISMRVWTVHSVPLAPANDYFWGWECR